MRAFRSNAALREFMERNLVFETTVITGWRNISRMMLLAEQGDAQAKILAKFINNWIRVKKTIDSEVCCLSCQQAEFLPGSFICLHTAIEKDGPAEMLISGICWECAKNGDDFIRETLQRVLNENAPTFIVEEWFTERKGGETLH